MKISPLIEESYLLRRSYVSDEFEQALQNLTRHCTVEYTDYRFKSGTEYNGWQIPQKWSVQKARILHQGQLFYDGLAHPLAVITNSGSFSGPITKPELLKHLHSAPTRPQAIPFHFRLSYRPWDHDWGFCLPHQLVEKLPDDDLTVELETTLEAGTMVVREFVIPGKKPDSIVFVAHLDHPGMTNDDLAGCAVGIALMNHIKETHTKPLYTYRLVLTQEILGSVFYLKALGKKRLNLKYGLFLEMLGNDNSLNLQKSFSGTSYIDLLTELALKQSGREYRVCNFRESAGNDEIAFEAPGIEIPMPSLSRWPYPEYHTSDDNMDLIHEEQLQESLKVGSQLVSLFESDGYVTRTFNGLVSLANPKYDLYIDPGQIITTGLHHNQATALFQYQMPRYLTGEYRISEIATIFNLDFNWVLDYYQKMAEKGLVTISQKKKKKQP
jgi:aminopeptidase-like protein